MDSDFSGFSSLNNDFKIDEDDVILPNFEESPNLLSGLKFKDQSLDTSFRPMLDPGNLHSSLSVSYEIDSPDDKDSDPVLKYLNQVLLEENMEERPSMFHDPLALQAAEKSFYDVIGQMYPPPPPPPLSCLDHYADSLDSLVGTSSDNSTTTSGTNSNNCDPQWVVDPGDCKSSVGKIFSTQSIGSGTNEQADSLSYANMIPNFFSDPNSILQFRKGMEEASKFLPQGNQLIIDLDKYELPPKSDQVPPPKCVMKVEEQDERDNSPNGLRGKKHLHRQESDLEEQRSSKQSALYEEEIELSEAFDRFLLFTDANGNSTWCCSDVSVPDGTRGPPNHSGSIKSRARNQGCKTEAVDLRTLLISCAQSVAADDRRTAYEQLKQIRQHSSPLGDACQRLANVFANGLEARLAGTGTQLYAALASKRISAVEKLKAYQVYLSACPFKKISLLFANKMIVRTALKAKTLHIVDFGILYGFQWPILIHDLSMLPDGPPKLRITGIEHPQPGFRPAERVEDTGRRLAKYCERFNVPFEYQAIATQNWETIKLEDLKINPAEGEVLAVNCLFRFNNLLDETVTLDSPRDAVLRLIRRMNPDIFVNAVVSGAYSAPFFVTRFRETLFHYSSLFDMFDATIPRDDQQRLNFEQEFYGREAINVIACEGTERVVRPDTFKQWQARHMRAGFSALQLNQELVDKLRCKVKAGYHKDFVFDEDGNWMLQGWKGRIICASSCWIPA